MQAILKKQSLPPLSLTKLQSAAVRGAIFSRKRAHFIVKIFLICHFVLMADEHRFSYKSKSSRLRKCLAAICFIQQSSVNRGRKTEAAGKDGMHSIKLKKMKLHFPTERIMHNGLYLQFSLTNSWYAVHCTTKRTNLQELLKITSNCPGACAPGQWFFKSLAF